MGDFFFNDTATTEIYTLSLHDALPICTDGTSTELTARKLATCPNSGKGTSSCRRGSCSPASASCRSRSEEHTSELQSRQYLVCRLLLEKKMAHQMRLHVSISGTHTSGI